MGLPSTVPPKSLTAISAAMTEPCPVAVAAGPDKSVSTPIFTTSSETCAAAGLIDRLFLKFVSESVHPQPNPTRHEWAAWDAFVFVADPDALAAEFATRGAPFHRELHDRDDGLRGFEIADADGYVLFFGRPR